MPNTVKPSNTEEEYFARENAERMRKLAAEQKKAMAQDALDALKKQHFMRCPKCGMELKELQFRGVLIDRCFNCNGTFLDAGELEKLGRPENHPVMTAVLNIFK